MEYNKTFYISVLTALLIAFNIGQCVEVDGEDINVILNNAAKRDKYIDCLRGTRECTEGGLKLKGAFQAVVKSGKSTRVTNEEAKEAAIVLIDYLADKLPDILQELTQKYVPKTFWQRLKSLLRKPIDWFRCSRADHNHAPNYNHFTNSTDAPPVEAFNMSRTDVEDLTPSEEDLLNKL